MQTAEIKNNMNGDARKASAMASEAASDVAHKAADAVIGFKKGFEHKYQELEDQAHALADASLDTVKRYPLYSVLGATAVGLVAGIFLARRN